MATVSASELTVASLERLLREADPGVLLVRPRLLQRIIKQDRGLPGLSLQVPHRKTLVIERDRLLEQASLSELELTSSEELPAIVVLVARPTPEKLTRRPRADVLRSYWRLLFHAEIHKELESPGVLERLTPSGVRERVHRIGQTRFEEIRGVLREEKFLLSPHDDRAVYVEFAACYLELRCFAPELLVHYFPSIPHREEIDAILSQDVDFTTLLERSRPAGAPDPENRSASPVTEAEDESPLHPDEFPLLEHLPPLSEEARRTSLERAARAAANGNSVRALILRTRVALAADVTVTQFGAGDDLNEFVGRLQRALRFAESEKPHWRQALRALLARATQGLWPIEARLLYDLQKACLDAERTVYSLDVVEWVYAFGKRPFRRPLPLRGLALQVKHLRSAEHRARAARLPEQVRRELLHLIAGAIHQSELRLRETIRPILAASLDNVGILAQNLPERMARAKLVEELLDRIVERGFCTMGDVRDAISRNRLKLPDLKDTDEFFTGDPLILLNRRLADSLAGVYRRGEIYLRWLQRGTSLFFGNNVGRLLTLYLLLPFGGAFVCLYGVHFLLHEVSSILGWPTLRIMPHFGKHHFLQARDLEPILLRVGICGLFFFGLIHWPAFRESIWNSLCRAAQVLYWLAFRMPTELAELPPVRSALESRPILLFRRHALRPLSATLIAGVLLFALGWTARLRLSYVAESDSRIDWLRYLAAIDLTVIAWVCAAVLVASWSFFNSRLGRAIEEVVLDRLTTWWQAIRMDLIPGFVRWLLTVFRQLLAITERLLYTVDEWLRFSTGDNRAGLVLKAALGLVWFVIAYIIRFTINLVAEPQVNPIKHFPVVTVSHKLTFPFVLLIKEEWLNTVFSETFSSILAGGLQFLIPGVCGFLAWELRENWRLYRSNQSPTLDPVLIGHHGENMLRFIRPGLHSGTLPKLHAKIRRAVRKGNWSSFRKKNAELHRVEESIRQFLDREFITLLHESRGWGKLPLGLGEIHLGSNHVEAEILCPRIGKESARICFEQQAGWLIAGVTQAGWVRGLRPEQHLTLTNALAGLYKLCGVDLVREQISACFRTQQVDWTIGAEGLVVWPPRGAPGRAVYPLRDAALVNPIVEGMIPGMEFPPVKMSQILFRRIPVYWQSWVEAWSRDQAKEKVKPLVGIRLLPD